MSEIHSDVFYKGPYVLVYAYPEIPVPIRILSVGIAFLGAYMAITFCEQYRLSKVGNGKQKSKLLSQNQVFFLMALAMGGVSVWARSFINLSGLVLYAPIIVPRIHVAIFFLVIPTILGLIVSISFSFIGLYIAAQDEMFGKSKEKIVEKFVAHSSKLSFKEIQKITNMKLIFIISTQSLRNLVVGAIIYGSGTILSLYLSISSMHIRHINAVFHAGGVVGCTILSWVFSIIAFWILFRLLSLYPHLEWLRLASASLMALNLFVIGFIMLQSVTFHIIGDITPSPSTFRDTVSVEQNILFTWIMVSAVVFCFIMVLIAFSDLRMWLYDKSAKVTSLETLLETLKKDPNNAQMITTYMRKHAKIHSLSDQIGNSSLHLSGTESSVSARRPKVIVSPWIHWLINGCRNNTVNPDDEGSVADDRRSVSEYGNNSVTSSPRGAVTTRVPSSPSRVLPSETLSIEMPPVIKHLKSSAELVNSMGGSGSAKTVEETPRVDSTLPGVEVRAAVLPGEGKEDAGFQLV